MAVRTKLDASRVLANVADDKRFFCRDGCVSKNLTELMNCFSHMTKDIFNHHVTSEKNDFSLWIRDVLGDDKLANDLTGLREPVDAAKVIRERITWLRKKSE